MKNKFILSTAVILGIILIQSGCSSTRQVVRSENKLLPAGYMAGQDTANSADINWRKYFEDEHLIALIDTALKNNQELNIMAQEVLIKQNEILARKGEYLPSVGLKGGSGLEKEGRYTRHGAVDEQLDISPGTPFPIPLTDQLLGAQASWEIDVWKKLRNAKKSSVSAYLASVEGRHFLVSNLIAEIAESYFELLALDNQLNIIEKNIEIQSNALRIVQQQKEAAKVTQLAVNRFEAQLLNTQNLRYHTRQKIVETENKINYLTGRFPQTIERSPQKFNQLEVDSLQFGIPSQLLVNRPDIRQAEYALIAAKLDVKVAKANFYPSLEIKAGIGFQAFKPQFLFHPESILYNLAGELMAPIVNRNAIKATYYNANAKQLQAVYQYEQSILNAYVDVLNQIAKLDNYSNSFQLKNQEVELLMQSVDIANGLFNSARADYTEVLFTQREALESKMELIEIKLMQMKAKVSIYRALGGGWN